MTPTPQKAAKSTVLLHKPNLPVNFSILGEKHLWRVICRKVAAWANTAIPVDLRSILLFLKHLTFYCLALLVWHGVCF